MKFLFFDELEKTNKGLIIDGDDYIIYKPPTLEVTSKIDKLLTEDFRSKHNNFILQSNIDKKEYYSKEKIKKSFMFDNGYYLEFHNTNKGYDFTIYTDNKEFLNCGVINYYEGQKHDVESIISDIADFTCYKFLRDNKEEIDAIDFEKINI